jgi:putative RNA 2'-phosphotransferase
MGIDSEQLLIQLAIRRPLADEELTDSIERAILGGLRHENSLGELRRDCFGLSLLDEFTQHLRRKFLTIESSRFLLLFQRSVEQLLMEERIEIRGDKIRALYGHSLRGVIVGEMKWPESQLFHATCDRHLNAILQCGLKPQGRTWVHLTSDEGYADKILRGHDYEGESVLLSILPSAIEDFNVTFRKPNSHVWLANHIPPVAIRICEQKSLTVAN